MCGIVVFCVDVSVVVFDLFDLEVVLFDFGVVKLLMVLFDWLI